MRTLHFKRFWQSTAWLLLATVVAMCLIPTPPSPPVVTWDKSQHLLTWGVLAWWFLQAWEGRHPIGRCLQLLAISAMVELLQGLTGYRSPDWLDLLANTLGVASGLILWHTPLGGTFHWIEGWLVGQHSP